MGSFWKTISAVSILLSLTACSSSPTTEGDKPAEDAPPATDAATDPVPAASAENPETASTTPVADAPPAPPASDEAKPAETVAKTDDASPPAPAEAEQPKPSTPAPAPVLKLEKKTAHVESRPAPASGAALTGQYEEYRVQTGDTLMKIAFETYGDLYRWHSIYDVNREKIKDPSALPKGLILKIEKVASAVSIAKNGEKYQIRTGDTLGTISSDVYGTNRKWKKLWENNKQMIRDPNRIYAGFYLYYSVTDEERQQADQMRAQHPEKTPRVQQQAPRPLASGGATGNAMSAEPAAPNKYSLPSISFNNSDSSASAGMGYQRAPAGTGPAATEVPAEN